MVDKMPPYSLEAEQSLLGAMLIDREAAETALETVIENDFYQEAHRRIFRTIATLVEQGQPVDIVTMAERLRQADALEQVGGASYISTLANSVPTAANAASYAAIITEKAQLRRVIRVATEAAQQAYEGKTEAVDTLQAGAMDIETQCMKVEPVSYRDMASEVFDIIEGRYNRKNPITGVPSGFVDLDDQTSGFQAGELAILAGRPSMGKSALSQCIAENAARAGYKVLLVILEDTPQNLMQRSVARLARIDLARLRRGMIYDDEWPNISWAMGQLPKLPVWYLGPVNVKVSTIRAAARRLKRGPGLDFIIVDYLQLLRPDRHRDNRYQEIAENSQALKAIGQELGIPVMALAQLSRAVEATQTKRPMLSHLRESGDIEQDADVVMLLFREDYYKPDTDRRGITEVIVAKQRNGPVGTVELRWNPSLVSFENLAKEGSHEAAHDTQGALPQGSRAEHGGSSGLESRQDRQRGVAVADLGYM